MGYPNLTGAGVAIHGEFSSADASGLTESAARFVLYGPGQTGAVSLSAANQVSVTDLVLTAGGTALVVQVFDGSVTPPSAGALIAKVAVPANGTVVVQMPTPHYCQPGTYPHIRTSAAGQVDVQLRGGLLTA